MQEKQHFANLLKTGYEMMHNSRLSESDKDTGAYIYDKAFDALVELGVDHLESVASGIKVTEIQIDGQLYQKSEMLSLNVNKR